jgi:hypothetical protein
MGAVLSGGGESSYLDKRGLVASIEDKNIKLVFDDGTTATWIFCGMYSNKRAEQDKKRALATLAKGR